MRNAANFGVTVVGWNAQGCNAQCRSPVAVRMIDFRAKVEKMFHYLAMTHVSRSYQGGSTFVVRPIDIGTVLQQSLHDIFVAAPGCSSQRCPLIPVGTIDHRAILQELFHHLRENISLSLASMQRDRLVYVHT